MKKTMTSCYKILSALAVFVCVQTAGALSAASAGLICQTDQGWCPAEALEANAPCDCLRDGAVLHGRVVPSGLESPFARLSDAASTGTRTLSGAVTASRLFAGPGQHPPKDFRAYGLVVFPQKASRFDEARHLMFCDAYTSTLIQSRDLQIDKSQQMVTIWPLARDAVADALQFLPEEEACDIAVEHYGLVQAQNALSLLERYAAESGAFDTSGRGPFLVAWTPGSGIASSEGLSMIVDLSAVDQPQDAAEQLRLWRDNIQDDPDLWQDEPQKPDLLTRMRRFFDRNGEILVGLGALK